MQQLAQVDQLHQVNRKHASQAGFQQDLTASMLCQQQAGVSVSVGRACLAGSWCVRGASAK